MVNNLQIAFDRATKKYFDQNSSDEEQVLLEYPPIEPVNKDRTKEKVHHKDSKKQKLSNKDKKPQPHKQNDAESSDDEDEIIPQRKPKLYKSKNTIEKVDKSSAKESLRASSCDKKKDKSTKGVKRKRKDKEKSDKTKTKKMKKDFSDHENDVSSSDEESNIPIKANEKVNDKIQKVKKSASDLDTTLHDKKALKDKKGRKIDGKHKIGSIMSNTKIKKNSIKEKIISKNTEKKSRKKNQNDTTNSDLQESLADNNLDPNKQSELKKKPLMKIKSEVSTKVKSNDKKKQVKQGKSKKLPKSNEKTKPLEGKSSTPKKKKTAKSENQVDNFSMSSGTFSRSPSPLPSIQSPYENMNDSYDFDNDTSIDSKKKMDISSRSFTPEIKDKFDLIKERRNKMLQEKTSQTTDIKAQDIREKNQKLKETIEKLKLKNDKSKNNIELMDEVLGGKSVKNSKKSVFDKLKEDEMDLSNNDEYTFVDNEEPKKKKLKADKKQNKEQSEGLKKRNNKDDKKLNKTNSDNTKSAANKNKQNKASLDVLDLETEQTLKDINKWLEHTPRFEYSSASNSPSRYIIDDIDMPTKMDDNDFRKPIPLLPSSPSASQTPLQSPGSAPKEFNLLKESNNNKQSSNIQSPTFASTSNKKPPKEPKRKGLKEKLQQLPRKKDVQRTIDRLQPGKTKGNLLSNIQNVSKPDELYPLGNREKTKEIKNSLIVQTDDNCPKLSLGTVLDTDGFGLGQTFNFKNGDDDDDNDDVEDEKKIVESETTNITLTKSVNEESENESKEKVEDVQMVKCNDKEVQSNVADALLNNPDKSQPKPNLNAWFKAFGVPKKPKKDENEDSGKISDNNEPIKNEIMTSSLSIKQRKLSTGSSVSERSSVEDSPQVGLDERLAPAPYPSPIGASPIMASPKTEDMPKTSSSNYPLNGSMRVGFYQDMTSTKSSPDKSCSPREMPSPSPYGQYSQPHIYSAATSGASPNLYGNYYNPDATNKSGQASYSKPTTSPASYYEQYKQPHSQESEFNNSMSPSTNPNSPYHSQQSSPYQQQPNSPFQSPANNSNPTGPNSNLSQAPNSPYSQPNSPYQQSQVSPFHQGSSTSNQPQKLNTQQTSNFNNQPASFPSQGPNSPFNQQQSFSPKTVQQNAQKPAEWQNKTNPIPGNGNVNANAQPQNITNFNPQTSNILGSNSHQQQMMSMESSYQSPNSFQKKSEPQTSGTPSTTPLYGTSKLPEMVNVGYSGIDMVSKSVPTNKDIAVPIIPSKPRTENNKYLDLSKQHQQTSSQINQTSQPQPQPQQSTQQSQQQQNQYQQMFDLSNYSKAPLDFDMSKNKAFDMLNRSFQKNNFPMAASCAASNLYGSLNSGKSMETTTAYNPGAQEASKSDLTSKSTINNLLNNPAGSGNFLNNMMQHQSTIRSNQQSSVDINYKQAAFNTPSASSMMDLTAFMRDYRQVEDRFSGLPGSPTGYYDKNMTPAHMFTKNLQQVNSTAAFQQMFNNPMTTMAYNREQQNMNLTNYQNRLNTAQQPGINSNAAHAASVPVSQIPETKVKKPRKKKNASPEIPAANPASITNQTTQHHHQNQSHQQHQASQLTQQLAHQQSFQSYAGLKIPSGTPSATESSAISLKSVVPGSAFNYGPAPPIGLYGENPAYLDEFRGTPNPYYPPGLSHRSTPDPSIEKSSTNPPPAHPQPPASPYHHLLPPHHPSRGSYPFMNSIDPATLQQQYRMMLNQTYQAGYHPALGMHNQPPWM